MVPEISDPNTALRATGLVKDYAGIGGAPVKRALNGIDLAVPRGSFFGLLGPNGAGKSTFINILAGLVKKSQGAVEVWGFDIDQNPRNARISIGVVPQELNIDAFFTPRQLMELQAGLYAVPKDRRRTMELLAAMGLGDKADAYARTLSGGMRRRLLVAKAMVHSPPIVVLDEPTAGVDVELRQKLWDYIRGLNQAGVTVLLTTHYLEEAEALCDRIAIINKGDVVACDRTQALLARLDTKGLDLVLAFDVVAVPAALARFHPEFDGSRRLSLTYRPSTTAFSEILGAVQAAGLEIADLSTRESDLEDIFLQLTQARE